MKQYQHPIGTAEEYIAAQPPEFANTLNELRSAIRAIVPHAEEMIRYGVICYKHRFMLVGIGTTQASCSFYVMNPEMVRQMRPELKDLKYSGSTIHFSLEEALPIKLIEKIVLKRVAENEHRAQFKAKKK
ncbi:MAG TPA: DUF1801 domain-containing protein [Eudoraea sp.]|nr:DUF1801 domain-containing protein [Eudoraea sp.]